MASKKERVWLEEYLKCFNATEAARRAEYKWPNKVGPDKLKKFKAEIEERLKEKAMSADEALAHLAEQARAGYQKYISARGRVDLAQMRQDGQMHLVRGTKYDSNGNLVVEFYDAQRALKTILQHHDRLGTRDEPIHVQLNAEDIVRARQNAQRPGDEE